MWSLLGAFDWNSLVVQDSGAYEVGAFDVRSVPPRRTALATLASTLATGSISDALAAQPGWWERGRCPTPPSHLPVNFARGAADPPILIAGAAGTLGSALVRACESRGLRGVALGHHQLDITSRESIRRALDRWHPWAVINAAGYVRVDDAEVHRDFCWRVNSDGAQYLAEAAGARQLRYVTVSADLVFDGQANAPYLESDATNPLNVYGLSKRAAEERVQMVLPNALIVRTAGLFGPADQYGFLTLALGEVSAGRDVIAANDAIVSPTYVPHVADAVLDLLIDREEGIWHLTNRGQVSWADFVALAATLAGLDESLVRRVSQAGLGLRARRPPFSALESERGQIMPTLEFGIREYLTSSEGRWRERRSIPRRSVGGAN
jgi:dTDP-4-dehydrorhamnose reductase